MLPSPVFTRRFSSMFPCASFAMASVVSLVAFANTCAAGRTAALCGPQKTDPPVKYASFTSESIGNEHVSRRFCNHRSLSVWSKTPSADQFQRGAAMRSAILGTKRMKCLETLLHRALRASTFFSANFTFQRHSANSEFRTHRYARPMIRIPKLFYRYLQLL